MAYQLVHPGQFESPLESGKDLSKNKILKMSLDKNIRFVLKKNKF